MATDDTIPTNALDTTPKAPEDEKTAPTGEPTPNATTPDANDPVDKVVDKEETLEKDLETDVARASNGILTKLEGAQKHIGDLRQKGHQLEGWFVELEQFLGGFVGKVKSVLSGKSAGV